MNRPLFSSAPIEVDFIGHATLMVRTQDLCCLFDPVLFDRFHEGLFEIYPPRTLALDAMPEVDVVVLTHRHRDHFDVPSLRALPSRQHIVIPDDQMLHDIVSRIGFRKITVVRDWDVLRFGQTELLFTPSLLKVPEVGVLISCGGATFWNQVDTAIDVSTVERISSNFGTLSFLLAPWQPSLEAPLQYNKSMSFPVDTYVRLLKRAAAVRAHALVPGACGFRHSEAFGWQDQLTFPITRERFLHDFSALSSNTDCHVIDPGDRVSVAHDGITVQHNAVAWVTKRSAWNSIDLRFAPSLASHGRRFTPDSSNEHRVEVVIERLKERLAHLWSGTEGVSAAERGRTWQVIFLLEIAISCEEVQHLHIDFRELELPLVLDGYSPLANSFAHVRLDSLEQLFDGHVEWDQLVHSGDYRTHSSVFIMSGREVRVPESPAVFDPLWDLFPYVELEQRSLESALLAPME